MQDLARTIPVLPSLNLVETQAFYVEYLSFRSIYSDNSYLILKRDDMEFHFWLAENADLPKSSSCYIRGGQVVALFDEYKARDVPKLSDFVVRSWGMKEFYIHDPHGNLLRFGAAPEEI
ncbi:MAG: VOC family protein [Pseudomonadota bacterium]